MKKNVLVFPCGSEIGLEIHRSLEFSTHFNIIGGSSVDDHGKFVYRDYVGSLPSVDDESFISRLNDVIKEREIDFIFPAHDGVVLSLAEAKSRGELACDLITSPLETCEISRSKRKTYELLRSKITVPELFEAQNVSPDQLPLFMKPDVGQGSKGTQKVVTIQEIEFYINKDPTLLLMEYLPGREYTVDCFTDYMGNLLFCEGRERTRISNGISVNSISVDDDRFEVIAKEINGKLVFRGVWFYQVKENDSGELVLMEISPRIAGTMGLVRNKGVNLALLSLFDASGHEVKIIENSYKMSVDRALQNTYAHDIRYDHVYIDFDDTLIVDGKVNVQLVSFIYQSINKGIQIHLITRHKKNLEQSLIQYRLLNIFDEIIQVEDGVEKHSLITQRNSIFIDDSYEERKKVVDRIKIPVFDPHMVEGLIEK